MKKLLCLLLILLSASSSATLPEKYVKIASDYQGNIIYGNIDNDYGNGKAWIATNYRNGKSSIGKYSAHCRNNTYFLMDYVLYSKRDLKGSVINSYSRALSPSKTVIPDTISEAIYNFICYGIY
ncbi:hypothetical protein A4G19_11325 [Pasteurellaceae bacterium Macca]|nr:hypothetical protein [Pasteurellaceae bacterium Macca]